MARTFRSEEQLRIQVISPNRSHLTDNIVTSTANDGTVTVNINGNLVVSGANAQVSNTEVEDAIMLLNRGGSAADIDSGIMIDRGSNNNAVFYWNEGDDVFKAVTSTSGADATSITDTALAKIQAGEPSASSDVATKNYVDNAVSGSSVNFTFVGDDSTGTTISAGETLTITGDSNIASTVTTDTVTLTLAQNLTGSSNGDLVLTANGTGSLVIDNVITFDSTVSDPATGSTTKIYHKAVGGGATGIYFKNPAGTVGELISKAKATALAIALG
jgi:hypothetical protein